MAVPLADLGQDIAARATEGEIQPIEGDQAPGAQEDTTATLPTVTTPYASLHPALLSRGTWGRPTRHRPLRCATAALGTPIPGVKLLSPVVVISLVVTTAVGWWHAVLAAEDEALIAETPLGPRQVTGLRAAGVAACGRASGAIELVVRVRGAGGRWRRGMRRKESAVWGETGGIWGLGRAQVLGWQH